MTLITHLRYASEHSKEVVAAVSEHFYQLAYQLTEKVISSGIQTADRSFDEMLCLFSVMLLDKFVPEYNPTEYKRVQQKYDGFWWDYTGFIQDKSFASDIGIGMEKSMNNYKNGKLAQYSYHFTPFEYRKLMFDHEIDVCHAVLQKEELSENQKEVAAKLIAEKYLKKIMQTRLFVIFRCLRKYNMTYLPLWLKKSSQISFRCTLIR